MLKKVFATQKFCFQHKKTFWAHPKKNLGHSGVYIHRRMVVNKNRLQAKKAEAPSKCHSRKWARYTVGPHAAAAIINGGSTTVVECASSEWLPAQFQRYFWQSYSPTEEVAPIGSPPQGARPWASTVGSATDLEHRSSAPLGFLVSTLVRLRQLGCHHRVRNHAPPIVCRNDTSY